MSSADALVHCRAWFSSQGWKAFPFQIQAWSSYLNGSSGIVNAPTGSGKTYSLLLPAIAEGIERSKTDPESCEGVQLIWITPIRALAKEINQSAERALLPCLQTGRLVCEQGIAHRKPSWLRRRSCRRF